MNVWWTSGGGRPVELRRMGVNCLVTPSADNSADNDEDGGGDNDTQVTTTTTKTTTTKTTILCLSQPHTRFTF